MTNKEKGFTMAVCINCGKGLSLWNRLVRQTICSECGEYFQNERYRWLSAIERDFSRGGVSLELETQMYQHFQSIHMPEYEGIPVIEKMRYFRELSEVQWGNVPTIRIDRHLDSDEYAYFSFETTYYNKQLRPVEGILVGTNKKCYFHPISGVGGVHINWGNISQVKEESVRVYTHPRPLRGVTEQLVVKRVLRISVSASSGGGDYYVRDPFKACIYIDTLVRIWKRQLIIRRELGTYGDVPNHVKSDVYKRDKGCCQQCGYSGDYIEYDHIIPRSKGGSNTVDNIQLLCRRCNLQKGDRL